MTNADEEKAREIAQKANECCIRSDGYEEDIYRAALSALSQARAEADAAWMEALGNLSAYRDADGDMVQGTCTHHEGLATVVAKREAGARAEAYADAARVARNGCLVPPDGGSPTEDERQLCDYIAEAIEAKAKEVGMNEWQSIETAPKDGTKVLVWSAAHCWRECGVAYWGRSSALNHPGWIGGHCHTNHIDKPTHWMPLPAPPNDVSP